MKSILKPGWVYQEVGASWRVAAVSNATDSSGSWISGCFHRHNIVLPVCFGIRQCARKHGSDGRVESMEFVNREPWMREGVHGYVHSFCSTHAQRKARELHLCHGCVITVTRGILWRKQWILPAWNASRKIS